MLKHHKSESLILDLKLDEGISKKVLLKEVQHDPVSDAVIQGELVDVSMTRKMRVNIPIILIGEPFGVTQEGGVLEQVLRELAVECLPGDMVETIEVDVSALKIGDSLMVRDIKVDPKLAVLSDANMAVASVTLPQLEEEPVAAAEAGAEAAAAEPEVIGKEKKEGEEEEGGAEKGEEEEGGGKEAKKEAKKEARKEGKKEPQKETQKEAKADIKKEPKKEPKK